MTLETPRTAVLNVAPVAVNMAVCAIQHEFIGEAGGKKKGRSRSATLRLCTNYGLCWLCQVAYGSGIRRFGAVWT